jgi:hypothetical protein
VRSEWFVRWTDLDGGALVVSADFHAYDDRGVQTPEIAALTRLFCCFVNKCISSSYLKININININCAHRRISIVPFSHLPPPILYPSPRVASLTYLSHSPILHLHLHPPSVLTTRLDLVCSLCIELSRRRRKKKADISAPPASIGNPFAFSFPSGLPCAHAAQEMNGRWRAHLPAASQARQGHPSLFNSLARDNHHHGDAQPDRERGFRPQHLILALVSTLRSPSFLPCEASNPTSQPVVVNGSSHCIIPLSKSSNRCFAPSGILLIPHLESNA